MKIIFSSRFILIIWPFLALFFPPDVARAQKEPVTRPEERGRWEELFIKGNIKISEWFDSVAEGLDLFLVGKKVTTRKNESNIRVENSTTSVEGKALVNSWGISVNPRLPNLEQYWHLKFASYDEREDRRNAKNAYLRQTPRQRNYGATVGLIQKLGNIRTAFQPRIELKDPLRVSHSLSFESVVDQKGYEINPKLEFYATPDRGVGAFQALNFHIGLAKDWGLTLINQADYEEKFHIYRVTNGFLVGHQLTDRSSYSYNVIFGSNNRPSYHLESLNLSVAYNEILYRKVLEFQIIPNLDFQKAVNFKGLVGITVNFNFNF